MLRQIAVARGLAGLPFEALQLGIERRHDVDQSLQIDLGRFEPQFRLVAARMQASDAGCLFEQIAAVGRFGIDDGPDAALADDCRRPSAGRGVGEQDMDVAGPYLSAIDLVIRSLAAIDAPDDLQFVRIVEQRWCAAVTVVQDQSGLRRGCAVADWRCRRI